MKIEPYINRLSEIKAIDGADELLKSLYKTKVPIALLTNRGNSTPLLLKQLNWTHYFSITLSASLLKNPKPNSEGLLKIAKKWNTKPDNLLFIGDSIVDLECANNANSLFWQSCAVHHPLPKQKIFPSLRKIEKEILKITHL